MNGLLGTLLDQAVAAAALHDGERQARELEAADHADLFRRQPRVVRQVALPRPLPEPVMPAAATPRVVVCDHDGLRAGRYAANAADLAANPTSFRCATCNGLLDSPLYESPATQALNGTRAAGQTGADSR